jgi:hypothetical protein
MATPALRSGSIVDSLREGGVTNVFVHAQSSVPFWTEARALAPELEASADRALLLAEARDVVCVTRPVEPAYLDFLAGAGIGPDPRRVVAPKADPLSGLTEELARTPELLDAVAEAIPGGGSVRISPFISGPGEQLVARRLEERLGRSVEVAGPPPELVRRCYRKDVMRRIAVRLGVPVPRGTRVVIRGAGDLDALRAAALRFSARTGRAIVRGVWGAAGSSTLLVRGDDPGLERELGRFALSTSERVFLVDEMLDAGAAPNVQVWIEGESDLRCFCVSDQRLQDETVHRGNTYPSRACLSSEVLEHAGVLAARLASFGYRGVAGFDFFEAEDPATGRLEAYFAELNPRFNGATYPAALLDRLGRSHVRPGPPPRAFATALVHAECGSFAELAALCRDALYTPGAGAGAVPFSVARLRRNLCTLAFLAQTLEEAEAGLAHTLLALGGRLAPLPRPEPPRARADT